MTGSPAGVHNEVPARGGGVRRIRASVLSVSWLPSEAVPAC